MTQTVPLIRWFTPIAPAYERDGISLEDVWPLLGRGERKDWGELRQEYRTVILADAGAGKTFEFKAEAERLDKNQRAAFFIRIEDIDADFGSAFEVGDPEVFETWIKGTAEAWFFLDSVDEVRLAEPRAFEKAIHAFAERIHSASHRAHVYISSRPYAWRTAADRALIDGLLPYESSNREAKGEDKVKPNRAPSEAERPESGLLLYRLAPLDADDIRSFAGHRGIDDVDALLAELERTALFELARLPFDLEDILATWREDKSLDSRLMVLKRGIRRRLAPPATVSGEPALPLERALNGARLLAVTATLMGEPNIRMPGTGERAGIDAAVLLEGWTNDEVVALLSRGIFTDAIYNMVRFRHREVRELLAAEWFADELANPEARPELEGLIFREVYGESIVVPKLRPILPWLILFDPGVRTRALALHPEIATEGGDAARLPLSERQKILSDIVQAIVQREERGGDNSAVARIAQRDLDADALALIDRYFDQDDAIFFLGRLAWQGRMRAAAARLGPIALDPKRGVFARLVSARAVAAVVGREAHRRLWQDVNVLVEPLPRRLLAELVDEAAPDDETVVLLLDSIGKLEPHERFEVTGLTSAIHRLIERLPVNGARAQSQPLATLVEGLVEYLKREPHIERRECRISADHRWLAGPAMHATEKLITGRASESFDEPAMKVLTLLPALRILDDGDYRERSSTLEKLVPRWLELNDSLFWQTVAERRTMLEAKGERLDDDWQVILRGHFWDFDAASFERTSGWITGRDHADDCKVALARSFRTYAENGRPKAWLAKLKQQVKGDAVLETMLAHLVRPPVSEATRKWRATERRWKQRQRERDATSARYRSEFVDYLKANPEVVRTPPGLAPGEISQDQYNLLRIIEGEGMRTGRGEGAEWKALIPEFGEAVAEAYRDGAIRQWRGFRPSLRSEGGSNSSIPYSLIFAMAGLEIEAGGDGTGLVALGDDEAQLALRYVLWELNGFPRWFEPLYRARPEMARSLIWSETRWELETSSSEESLHYVLHDLVYYAPWLHSEIAVLIVEWLGGHDIANADCLRYARHILISGGTPSQTLATLAKSKTESATTPKEQLPSWYALWVDTDPDAAILAVEAKIDSLSSDSATSFAEAFVVSLLGGRGEHIPVVGAFRTPEHLQTLYVLMHKHIRVADDIDRANKGIYSPTRRDEAQEARSRLFSLLAEIPGESTYRAITQLASDHPEPDYRSCMGRQARARAMADGDLPNWATEQMCELTRRLGEHKSTETSEGERATLG